MSNRHKISQRVLSAMNRFLDNEKHLKVVLDALESDLDDGQHYFTLP